MANPVRFIATMAAVKQTDSPMLRVDLFMEYPASAPASKRGKLDFHSRIPMIGKPAHTRLDSPSLS